MQRFLNDRTKVGYCLIGLFMVSAIYIATTIMTWVYMVMTMFHYQNLDQVILRYGHFDIQHIRHITFPWLIGWIILSVITLVGFGLARYYKVHESAYPNDVIG